MKLDWAMHTSLIRKDFMVVINQSTICVFTVFCDSEILMCIEKFALLATVDSYCCILATLAIKMQWVKYCAILILYARTNAVVCLYRHVLLHVVSFDLWHSMTIHDDPWFRRNKIGANHENSVPSGLSSRYPVFDRHWSLIIKGRYFSQDLIKRKYGLR